MTRRSEFALMIGAALVLQTGCCFGAGSTSDIRYEFSDRTGVEVEPEFGIKLGRIGTGFPKMFVKSSDEELSLNGIRKIEVGIYDVVDRDGRTGSGLPAMELDDWVTIVRARDGDECIQILCRPEGERIRALVAVVLDDDELVVVRLKGRLEKFLPAVLKKTGWAGIGDELGDLG